MLILLGVLVVFAVLLFVATRSPRPRRMAGRDGGAAWYSGFWAGDGGSDCGSGGGGFFGGGDGGGGGGGDGGGGC